MVFTLLSGLVVLAASVQFSADLDRTQIGLDESVTLRLKLEANESIGLDEPTLRAPDFDELNSYPQTFLKNSWINGKIEAQSSLYVTKILKPKREGTFKIDQIQAVVGGKTYTAPPLTVRVVQAGAGTPSQGRTGMGGLGHGAPTVGKGRDFFVKAEVNTSKVYRGEQVILSYYLYRKAQIRSADVRKFPDLGDFVKQELEVPVQSGGFQWEQVVVGGQVYMRALLFRYAAYPLKEGKAKVDPAQVEMQIPTGRRWDLGNLGDDFDTLRNMLNMGGVATRPTTVRSEPLQIEVLPLPQTGKPLGFKGLVGELEAVAVADKTELKADEAVTVTLKLEGRANLAGMEKPEVQWPTGVDVYEVRDHDKTALGGITEKVFEYVLVPRKEGVVTLPGFKIPVFQPSKKSYVQLSTEPILLKVGPADASGGKVAQRPLPKNEILSESPVAFSGLPKAVWAALGVGLILVILSFLRLRTQKRHSKKKREPTLREKLGPMEKIWSAAIRTGSAREVERIIWDVLSARLDCAAHSLTRGEIRDRLSLEEAHWQELEKALDWLEAVRFSGKSDSLGPDSPFTENSRKSLEKILFTPLRS